MSLIYTTFTIRYNVHYLITSWSKGDPENLRDPQLVKIFFVPYKNRMFIAAFTGACYLSLF
jgi:hypothetical protein